MRTMSGLSRMLVLAVGVIAFTGCPTNGPPRLYANNDLQLVTANAAKMVCSCVFVSEMPMSYCKAWVKASPDVASFNVDSSRKTVEAAAFVSWTATARYVDDKRGCVLE
jgi:hypothetical protein